MFHPHHEGFGGHFRHQGGRRGFGGFVHMHGFGGRERGGLKYEILAVLWEGPRHGYEVMLAIEERRGYRPSPGSIYPALQLLEDEDYIKGSERDGKRIYTITEKGSELLQQHRDENPEGDSEDAMPNVKRFARGIGAMHGAKEALKQIARLRDTAMMDRAIDVMERARRELYAILSEGA